MSRINVICLGVRDMKRSLEFYREGLGFETDEKEENPKVVFFDTPGTKFELYPIDLLALDISEKDPPKISRRFSGVTLAYNAASEEGVVAFIARAKTAGAKVVKEPQKAFWGGFHGYFMDPDGYYWEVAYNPFWSLDEKGMIIL